MTIETIKFSIGGRLRLESSRPLKFDLGLPKPIENKERKVLPSGVDLSVFNRIIAKELSELSGEFPESSWKSDDEIKREAKKLSSAGFTGKDIANLIVFGTPQVKTTYHLGEMSATQREYYSGRIETGLSEYFPKKAKKS